MSDDKYETGIQALSRLRGEIKDLIEAARLEQGIGAGIGAAIRELKS